jgi:hypothetical protein
LLLVDVFCVNAGLGSGEIPGGATLELEVELLSIKNTVLGYRDKKNEMS